MISANKDNHMQERPFIGSFPLLPKTDVQLYPTSDNPQSPNGKADGSVPDVRNPPNDGSTDNNTSQNDLIVEEGTIPKEITSGSVRSGSQVSPEGSSQEEAASNAVRSSDPPSPQGSTNKEVAPVWSDIVSGEEHYNSPDTADNRSALSDGNIDDYNIDPNDEEYGYDNDAYGDEGMNPEEEEYSEEEGQGDYAPGDDW